MSTVERARILAWRLKYPGENRCAICSFPLAASADKGCVIGNCSYRPHEGTAEHERISRHHAEIDLMTSIIVAELERHPTSHGATDKQR